ncbi:Polyadenylate-binding protein [Thalictrum thalictroides]|uniref:Polyadenylate-binding protein n=1 Tax=Thalictrum thalictroides TaxID=46969 RepID=A0A7J6VKG5_THATH|nr:Polyadenylate-binding protein [Thalictrum thalictroides]
MAVVAVAPTLTVQAPASLYVGDLHPDANEGKLFEAFAGLENLVSVRVCRDSNTGRSLGYGYVNFISPQDAIRAIEKVNHTTVNGKIIRVMWSHRDSEGRKSGIGNLFVKNLSTSVDNVKLHEIFSKFGNILSCKVAITLDGQSKGYGFVQFDSADSSSAAISNLNGTIVEDKPIYVGNFVKRSDRASSGLDAKYTNLYMKNLDQDVTEEMLREKFLEFGTITDLVVSKDDNGDSRGFGFVNFDSPDNAKRALQAMNGTQLGSKVLYVARAQKKAERAQILRRQFEERRREQIQKFKGSNLYVKNLDDEVDADELRELFSQCGTITSIKLMHDEKGVSKGFGFVCFSTPEEANKAVSILHGYMLRRKPLYVAIAQRKEERQAQLQLQFAQRVAGIAGPPAAVVPSGYPPIYYTPSPGMVTQMTPRQGLMYQTLGMRPGWRPNGFAPQARPSFQPVPHAVIPNAARQQRQNRGRMNGHVLPHGGAHSAPFVPYFQPAQSVHSLKGSSNQQRGEKYMPNGRSRELNNGSAVSSAASNSAGSGSKGLEMLSSMLAAASPQQQKQILGERLYPLVEKLKHDLAAKITGMLLEMDNSELLLLLESPESLASKIDEAVQVLKISNKTKAAGQEVHHPNYLSAEVAVN